jgi:prophage maintenance system killer protein
VAKNHASVDACKRAATLIIGLFLVINLYRPMATQLMPR